VVLFTCYVDLITNYNHNNNNLTSQASSASAATVAAVASSPAPSSISTPNSKQAPASSASSSASKQKIPASPAAAATPSNQSAVPQQPPVQEQAPSITNYLLAENYAPTKTTHILLIAMHSTFFLNPITYDVEQQFSNDMIKNVFYEYSHDAEGNIAIELNLSTNNSNNNNNAAATTNIRASSSMIVVPSAPNGEDNMSSLSSARTPSKEQHVVNNKNNNTNNNSNTISQPSSSRSSINHEHDTATAATYVPPPPQRFYLFATNSKFECFEFIDAAIRYNREQDDPDYESYPLGYSYPQFTAVPNVIHKVIKSEIATASGTSGDDAAENDIEVVNETKGISGISDAASSSSSSSANASLRLSVFGNNAFSSGSKIPFMLSVEDQSIAEQLYTVRVVGQSSICRWLCPYDDTHIYVSMPIGKYASGCKQFVDKLLIITNMAVYVCNNGDKYDMERRILWRDIKSLCVKSQNDDYGSHKHFALQVPLEYDLVCLIVVLRRTFWCYSSLGCKLFFFFINFAQPKKTREKTAH